MKTKVFHKLAILASLVVLILVMDLAPQPPWLPFDVEVITDAEALAGRQRRTRRRGAAAGYEAGQASTDQANAQQQQQEQEQPEQQQPEQQQPPAASQTAPATPPPSGALPLGSVVNTLPEGCTKKVVNNVEYQFDGTNYYRAAFQGNELVYVTSQP